MQIEKLDLQRRKSFGTLDWLNNNGEPSGAELIENKINEIIHELNHILEERESGIKVCEEAQDMYDNAILDALKDKQVDIVVEPADKVQDDHYWFKQQERYKAALVLIRDLTGAGMSYLDIVIEMREIAKWALNPHYKPLLIGRYNKKASELLDVLRETKGGYDEIL